MASKQQSADNTAPQQELIALKYIDKDAGRAIANLPPRDVTQSEIDACGYSIEQILSTGIYQLVDNAPQTEPAAATSEQPPAQEQTSEQQPDTNQQEGQA